MDTPVAAPAAIARGEHAADHVDALEPAVRDEWYCLGAVRDLPQGSSATTLLGAEVTIHRAGDAIDVAAGRPVPALQAYGHLWASLGEPAHDVPQIPEALEDDRRFVPCGAVTVNASGLRIVENLLDMAHFPFVHTDVLGSEEHPEVKPYACEIRRDVDEVWARECTFTQPRAALAATGAIETDYTYRVVAPFAVLLYKTCPLDEARWDVICLFVQPLGPARCRAHPVMFLLDETSSEAQLIQFQQAIFLQDRIILENQRPVLLPLEPRAETPTRADASSVAYRRWLKEKALTYGTTLGPAAVRPSG